MQPPHLKSIARYQQELRTVFKCIYDIGKGWQQNRNRKNKLLAMLPGHRSCKNIQKSEKSNSQNIPWFHNTLFQKSWADIDISMSWSKYLFNHLQKHPVRQTTTVSFMLLRGWWKYSVFLKLFPKKTIIWTLICIILQLFLSSRIPQHIPNI